MEKSINIAIIGRSLCRLDQFNELQGNLKDSTEDNFNHLKESLVNNGLLTTIAAWKDSRGKIWTADGHQRLKALTSLRDEGFAIPEIPTDFIAAKDKREAKKKLLIINGKYARMTYKGLYEFANEKGFEVDMSELSGVDFGDITIEGYLADFMRVKPEEKALSPEEQEKIAIGADEMQFLDRFNYFIIEFSGGRDSSLAMLKTLPYLRGKQFEAVYVETGAEFPSVTYHVISFCKNHGVPLRILTPKQHILQYYMEKECFPDSIYRDCQHKFIVDTVDRYVNELKARGLEVLIIRGGRKSQKTRLSHSDKFQVLDGKQIYNPIFDLDKETYNREIAGVPLWPGYAAGFDRTACWFCPFQKKTQWEAMKKAYPFLWEALRDMCGRLHFPKHKGDHYFIDMFKYFGIKTS